MLKKGQNVVKVPVMIQNPILWWCNGLGVPHQYLFQFTLEKTKNLIDQNDLKIGLRTIN